MAGFGWQIARSPVEPGSVIAVAPATTDDGEAATTGLFLLGNIALTLALLALFWTPWVLFWAVVALVPVVFFLMVRLAWWAAQGDVQEAPLSPAPQRQRMTRIAGPMASVARHPAMDVRRRTGGRITRWWPEGKSRLRRAKELGAATSVAPPNAHHG